MVTVRYFAAAARPPDRDRDVAGRSVGDLVASMVRSMAGLQNVLARCSLLAAGVRVSDERRSLPTGHVDVLPPFAAAEAARTFTARQSSVRPVTQGDRAGRTACERTARAATRTTGDPSRCARCMMV